MPAPHQGASPDPSPPPAPSRKGLPTSVPRFNASPATSREASPAASPLPAPSASPVGIPLAEVVQQADAVTTDLTKIQADLASDPVVDRVESGLTAFGRDFDKQLQEVDALLYTAPALDVLRSEEERLQALGQELPQWKSDLTSRATRLDALVQRLNGMTVTWEQTLALALVSETPPELDERIHAVIAGTKLTCEQVEKQRALVLKLQARVAERAARLGEMLADVRRVKREAVGRLLDRDTPPVWQRNLWDGRNVWDGCRDAVTAQVDVLVSYLGRHVESLLVHFLVIVFVAGNLVRVRPRVRAWAVEEPACENVARILEVPVQVAIVLSLLLVRWLYPQPPRVWAVLISGLALLPAAGILRRLIEPSLFPLLYAVVVAYLLDVVRTADYLLMQRLIVLVQMLGGIVFLHLFSRARTATLAASEQDDAVWRTVRVGGRIAMAGFAASVLANLSGYFSLAKLLDTALLGAVFLALVFYAVVRVLEGLAMVALRVRPLCLLEGLSRHRAEVGLRVHRVVVLVAVVLWAAAVLDLSSLRGPVVAFLRHAWSDPVVLGFSAGSVVSFVITVWASFVISRFVRFLLDEDVYPRLTLARGIPFAISTLLHYSILLVGFLLATSALGVDMTNFTILAGAFSLGLGFGLQNILNNFVSGLILLFERPVKVGDVVDLKTYSGRLEHIGLRASVLRTFGGSAVVVPNGTLISNEFVNWTFSDARRRVDVTVGVAYGCDPEVVLALLQDVARAHPEVLADPKPQALFLGFGDSALDVTLRAWTENGDRWADVQSDLNCAVYRALTEAGITIPFPQQDLHIQGVAPDVGRLLTGTPASEPGPHPLT